ncbi:MAG: GLUG motif-containing protein, partial [Mycoplasmatales bacterium]
NVYADIEITKNDTDEYGGSAMGGIVGYSYGDIKNAYANSQIITSNSIYVGGVVGRLIDGTVENVYSTGNIVGMDDVGGIIGYFEESSNIKNAYTTADVTGERLVGGAIGGIRGFDDDAILSVRNIYATGDVTGEESVGKVVGSESTYGSTGIITISNIYSYEGQKITGSSGSSSEDGSPVTAEELADPTWYTNTLGWDSSGNKGEPELTWTAPWSEDGKVCMPHLYNDTDLDGTNLGNDGTYIPNQPCTEVAGVVKKVSTPQEKIEQQEKDENLNTLDVSSLQQSNDTQIDIEEQSKDVQDETIKTENEDNIAIAS